MTITDNAREKILEVIKEEEMDGLRVTLKMGHATVGQTLSFRVDTLEEGEEATMVNGVPILMNAIAAKAAQSAILDMGDSGLVVRLNHCCGSPHSEC